MQTLFRNLFAKKFISTTSLVSFPQAERVGNPSEKKDSGQARIGSRGGSPRRRVDPTSLRVDPTGMTKLESSGSFTDDRISNSIAFSFMYFGG